MTKPCALHIVIISAVYPPEPVVSARMSRDLAQFLVESGHKVTVLCPQPSRPLNADYSNYNNYDAVTVCHVNGIEIVRLPSFTEPESRLISRLYESWSFGRHACLYLAKSTLKPDVMYVNAWPLLAQAHIMRYAKRYKIPVTLQIMDIYPESLLEKLPSILRNILSLPLIKLDTWIAQQAQSIVVISDNMRRTYIENRAIPADSVTTIPTWQDEALFVKIYDRISACERYKIPVGLFTFLYLGNIGPVAGVDFLIRAFHDAAIDTAQLVIVGDGSAKADCVKLVEDLNISGIHFVSDPDAANVPLLQSMAHVCLLPMKSGTGMSSIPSKLPAYLFSAKPILATVDPASDTARLIQEAQCGWIGEAENLDWLASKMVEVVAFSDVELKTRGSNGQRFGIKNFSKSHCVEQLAEVVLAAASTDKGNQQAEIA